MCVRRMASQETRGSGVGSGIQCGGQRGREREWAFHGAAKGGPGSEHGGECRNSKQLFHGGAKSSQRLLAAFCEIRPSAGRPAMQTRQAGKFFCFFPSSSVLT